MSETTEAILLHAAPDRSADLFHAVPLGIGDAFTYLEAGGRRVAVISVLERDAVQGLGVEVIDPSALGRDELFAQGMDPLTADAELALRAAQSSASSARPCRRTSRCWSPTTCARPASSSTSTPTPSCAAGG